MTANCALQFPDFIKATLLQLRVPPQATSIPTPIIFLHFFRHVQDTAQFWCIHTSLFNRSAAKANRFLHQKCHKSASKDTEAPPARGSELFFFSIKYMKKEEGWEQKEINYIRS